MRALWLAVCLAGCGAQTADPGLRAKLQVVGASFQDGAMPAASTGPAVIALNMTHRTIAPGAIGEPLLGTLDAGATTLAVGLQGDVGFWIVRTQAPDTDTPTMPGLTATLSFAATLPPGPILLVAHAVDAAGNFGPERTLELTVADLPPPAGQLVVSLRWGGRADLDLHVIDPNGVEIWADAPAADGGRLDLDSNAQCVLDGHDSENIVWTMAPPSGHYVVRIDSFSLCGDPSTAWRAEAFLDGMPLAAAIDSVVDTDTNGAHQKGAGRDALAFDVP